MKVLLVDDDPAFMMAAKELLLRAGHQVDVAWDGSEALVAASREEPEIVVLDYKMPGFKGDATARLLRRTSPNSRIVGVSALTDVDTGWADGFLSKDRVLDELIPLIERLGA